MRCCINTALFIVGLLFAFTLGLIFGAAFAIVLLPNLIPLIIAAVLLLVIALVIALNNYCRCNTRSNNNCCSR